MKTFSKVLMALIMCITLAGCSNKRGNLLDDQVIAHMKEKGYALKISSNNDTVVCGFLKGDEAVGIFYLGELGLGYLEDKSIYSNNSDTIVSGNKDKKEMKEAYHNLLKETDVTEEEATKVLKSKYSAAKEEIEAKKKEEANKVYGIGERVVVAQGDTEYFAFTINSIKVTSDRNQFSDKNPTQVIIINYSYENIAMDDDLYISSSSFNVVDADSNVAETYPASKTIYPKKCPVGAKSDGEEAYGLMSGGNTIKLRLEEYIPGSYDKVTRNFELSF